MLTAWMVDCPGRSIGEKEPLTKSCLLGIVPRQTSLLLHDSPFCRAETCLKKDLVSCPCRIEQITEHKKKESLFLKLVVDRRI